MKFLNAIFILNLFYIKNSEYQHLVVAEIIVS